MGSNQFDKIIKDKVQFHETSVDPGLWDKIEAALPVEETSRRLPLFWLISISLVLVSTIGFLGYHVLGKADTKILPSHNKNSYAAAHSDKNQGVTGENTIHSNSGFTNPSSKSSLLSSSSSALTEIKSSEAIKAGRKQNLQTKKSNITPIQGLSLKNNQSQIENIGSSEINEAEKIVQNNKDNSENSFAPYSVLPMHFQSLTSTRNRKYTIKDNCLSDFSSSPKNIFIEAYFGNDIPIRKLVARQPEFEKLAAARRASEKPIYSFSIGARLGFFISKDFQLLTGINYSQINEKFEYVDPESSQTKIVQTTIFINDGMGNIKDSLITFDTIMIPGTLVYKIRNQYTTIDIPFLLGYKIWENDKINIVANVGVMANIMLKKEGMALLENTLTASNFSRQDAGTFNHSLGLSTNLGLQFNYNLSHHLDMYIEPNVRFQHRGLTTEEYPVRHNYSTISFLTGVRYKF